MIRDFLNYNAQTSPFPPLYQFVRAEGIYLFDKNDKAYIDLISGIAVSNVGHKNTDVITAIQEQSQNYLHQMVYGEYVQTPQTAYAKELIASTHPDFEKILFVNSGAEAVEASLKLCQKYTQRKKFVALKNAYHGSTLAASCLMDSSYFRQGYFSSIEVDFIEANDLADIKKIDTSVAGVIVEIIRSEAGIQTLNDDFLQQLKKQCEEQGSLLIVDEIQTGLGRTGSLWAYQQSPIVPDILLSAKALGAGLPLGAVLASGQLLDVFKDKPILGYMTTMGGNPLSCAAGLAAFRFIQKQKLYKTALEKEKIFRELLGAKYPIRGRGLFLALELGDEEKVLNAVRQCAEAGVLTDWFLHCPTALRIAPPLTISSKEIEVACERVRRALSV